MNQRIEEIRRNAGLSQEAFGERLDVSMNYVWMIENGKRVPSDRLIKSICREFNVNEEWLRTGEGSMKTPEPPPDELDALLDRYKLPRRLRGLFIRYGKLPETSQAAIRDWLDGWILEVADGIRAEQGAEPRNVHDWTDDEILAETKRQLDEEKKGTGEPSTGCPDVSGADCA